MRQFNRSLMGFMVSCILLCVAGSFSVSVWATPQESEKELTPDQVWAQKGLEFFKKKEYPAVIKCYQKASELNPQEITWPISLSRLYLTIENFPEALQMLAEVWDTFPDEENRNQILIARADVHFWWGKSLSKKYDHLNAILHYEEAYKIDKNLRPKNAAADLHNIGFIYNFLGEKEKALGYYEQALPICRAVGDREGEATTLNNIGGIYDSLGEKEKALSYYELALPLRRAVGDRRGEATTLNNIGMVYSSLGEKEKALGYYEQALPIFVAIGDRANEAGILGTLMLLSDAFNNKPMAIFYGKQAVNTYQLLRKNIATLPNETKLSYLNSAPFRGVKLNTDSSTSSHPIKPYDPTVLYEYVFKPIEKDLQEYRATNLLVYLDGVLWYIPLPTLWDGQHFLLQRYRLSTFTTSSLPNIKDVPAEALKVLGMAAAKGSTDLSSLPYAKAEITAIVKDDSQKECTGLITGIALIDEQFTKTAMSNN